MGVSLIYKILSKYAIFSERKLEDKVFVFDRLKAVQQLFCQFWIKTVKFIYGDLYNLNIIIRNLRS
jgi:hypothetical protein